MRNDIAFYTNEEVKTLLNNFNNSLKTDDKLLRHIMIRRNRKKILEFYKDDIKKQEPNLSKTGTPVKINYTFDKLINEVLKETMYIINNLDYVPYTPLLYLKDNKESANILVLQNVSGFMKSIFVKRLESSFFAFKKTLSRFIESYEQFIRMSKSGNIYISKKINVIDLLDNSDGERFLELEQQEGVHHFKTDEFTSDFILSLQKDLRMLRRLKLHWDTINIDPKLDQFKKELINNKVLKDDKIIIFTESKETAKYLETNLKCIFKDKVVSFSEECSEYVKRNIEYSFNPKYKEENRDKYDVLITTDTLPEGINLHRANVLINYDLPWNPIKMLERCSRLNSVSALISLDLSLKND